MFKMGSNKFKMTRDLITKRNTPQERSENSTTLTIHYIY